ncbi:MAG TPA: hypothetical protein VLE89_08025 [Chlamydiales bacterium]|nr:hypothetical protein [Chlamydiales bacterium]
MRFFLIFSLALSLYADKLLVLSSDEKLQTLWQSYMDSDPEHIEAYFIQKTDSGTLNETILSMEAFLPRLNEFDYVLRTELSPSSIFPRLLDHLKTLPKTGLYSAPPIYHLTDQPIGSGSAILLSPDLVELIVAHKHQLLNQQPPDHIVLGFFLLRYGFSLLPLESIE